MTTVNLGGGETFTYDPNRAFAAGQASVDSFNALVDSRSPGGQTTVNLGPGEFLTYNPAEVRRDSGLFGGSSSARSSDNIITWSLAQYGGTVTLPGQSAATNPIAGGIRLMGSRAFGILSAVLWASDITYPVDLYRSVSQLERIDIQTIGGFRASPQGYEGKLFALTLQDARYYRDEIISRIPGSGPQSIVHTKVSHETFTLLDQIVADRRAAVYVGPGQFHMLNQDARRFGIEVLE